MRRTRRQVRPAEEEAIQELQPIEFQDISNPPSADIEVAEAEVAKEVEPVEEEQLAAVIAPSVSRRTPLPRQVPDISPPASPVRTIRPLTPRERELATVEHGTFSPRRQLNVRVDGIQSVRATDLNPLIPQIENGQVTFPRQVERRLRALPKIELPHFNTYMRRIKEVPRAIVKPSPAETLAEPDPIQQILSAIDVGRMIETRTGKIKAGYSLREIQGFARDVGLATANKRKAILIQELQRMMVSRGILTQK